MPDLHPTIAEQLRTEEAANRPPIHELSIEAARARLREDAAAGEGTPPSVAETSNRTIPGPDDDELPLRVYTPTESDRMDAVAGDLDVSRDDAGESPLPVLCWFHGGGFALGDLETTDPVARALASEGGCIVVTVDYRLAPEHPFPAGLEDCYAAFEWTAEHAPSIGGDPERIAVGGGSAGGGLAAAACLLARDRDGPEIAHQVLVCPVTTDEALPSHRENAEGYGLTAAEMEWYHGMYAPDPIAAANPYAYPLKARDLDGLPPATVITAEFDPLRDDGGRYAERLDAAEIPTTYREITGVTHSFFGMLVEPSIDPAWEAMSIVASDLEAAFSGPTE